MDDTISKLEKAIYEDLAAPEEWFGMPKRLEAAAFTLQQHHPISKDKSQVLEDRAQEYMLWGFCLENLLKGLLARKKQREGDSIIKIEPDNASYAGPKHDLNKIADQIHFKRDAGERLALEFFSKVIVYFGRYPLPVSSKKLTVYWDQHFDDVLKILLIRLRTKACASA